MLFKPRCCAIVDANLMKKGGGERAYLALELLASCLGYGKPKLISPHEPLKGKVLWDCTGEAQSLLPHDKFGVIPPASGLPGAVYEGAWIPGLEEQFSKYLLFTTTKLISGVLGSTGFVMNFHTALDLDIWKCVASELLDDEEVEELHRSLLTQIDDGPLLLQFSRKMPDMPDDILRTVSLDKLMNEASRLWFNTSSNTALKDGSFSSKKQELSDKDDILERLERFSDEHGIASRSEALRAGVPFADVQADL